MNYIFSNTDFSDNTDLYFSIPWEFKTYIYFFTNTDFSDKTD